MTRTVAMLGGGLIAVGVATFCLWHKATALKAENDALRAGIANLEQAAQRPPAVAKSSEERSAEYEEQKRELLRLRGEVTQLRAERDAAVRVPAQSAGLKKVDVRGESKPVESIPREDWKFSGYDTPQAAFISTIWAMKEGQREVLLNSFSPEERQRFETQLAGKNDAEVAERFQKEFGGVTGVQVLTENQTASGEVVLDVYLEGLGALKKYSLVQVGNEWKAGGPVNQNPAPAAAAEPGNDPLSFYRLKPELRKRYFPHIFQADQEIPPPPAESAATGH